MSTLIARTVARTVVPLVLVTAVALLLQGHNRPGGGFIAGVLTAAAVALLLVVYGLDAVEEDLVPTHLTPTLETIRYRIVEDARALYAVGLALATGSGIVAMGFGEPFLTQTVRFLHDLPVYGELEVASALAFDLGVFAVVVGSLLAILAVVGGE